MPQLLQTAKLSRLQEAARPVGNSHQHFVYIVEPTDQNPLGYGATSFNKGHRHKVEFAPPGQWVVQPADSHTHEIAGEYNPDITKEPATGQELVGTVEALYLEAKQREADSREAAYKADAAYTHDQWDETVRRKLESQQRAAITVNKLEQKVDNLCGYQRQNRTDWRFYPMENGDQRVADILNILTKHITDRCFYGREESKVFEDAVVAGRGAFNVYVDFSDKVEGEIKIERFKWDEVYYGPHEKEDLSDCDYLVKTKWYTLAKLKELYPGQDFSPEVNEAIEDKRTPSEDWRGGSTPVEFAIGSQEDFANIAKKEYRLLECWRKEYRRVSILTNARDGFVLAADGWSSEDVAQVKTIPGFRSIPRVVFRMRVSKVANHRVLEDDYPDLAVQDFHTYPLYGKYRNGKFHGKLRGVMDLQLLINKCYSQFVDILNKVTNYGWFYDNNTFPSRKEEEQWVRHSATPGFNIKLNDTKKPPEKVESPKFPAELANSLAMFAADMREVMNINLEVMGQNQDQQSGVAMRQKIVQQLIGNDFLFDNLSFVKKKLGRLIVAYIQQLYTPKRIMRIVLNENQREPVQLGGQPIPMQDEQAMGPEGQPHPNDPVEIERLLTEQDLTNYDIIVSEAASSPSAMMSNFLLLLDMAAKGIQIPPSAIIEFAPLPNKNKILEQIAQAQQMQQQQEAMKYNTEIEKAKIAQAGKNPGMAGLPPGGQQPPMGVM